MRLAWLQGRACARLMPIALLCPLLACSQSVSAAPDAFDPRPSSSIDGFARAQPYLETIATEEVPYRVVTAMTQDANGFIWFGSQEGLIRYDGYRFRTFRHDPADPRSMAGNYVMSLSADRHGRVFVGTVSDGVTVYNPVCECFDLSYQYPGPDSGSVTDGSVNALLVEADGGMYIGTDTGLSRILPGAGRVERVDLGETPANAKVMVILRARDDSLWIGTSAGLLRRGPDTKHFAPVPLDHGASAASAEVDVRALFQAQDGKIWVGTRTRGAAWLDPADAKLHWIGVDATREELLAHPFVDAIGQPEAGEIWIGSYGGGLARVAAADGRVLQRLRHDAAMPGVLAHDQVSDLMIDRSGLFWIGMWGGGVQRYNPKNAMARTLRHSPSDAASLSQSDIHAVLERADGTLLLGTQSNGIDVIDRQRGRIDGHRPIDRGGRLPDGSINAIMETADGTLWVGTQQAGVLRLDPGSREWRSYGIAAGLPDVRVFCLLAARDGRVFAGTESGLASWRADSDRFERHVGPEGEADQPRIRSIAEDADGRIWAGGLSGGLRMLAPGQTRLQAIRNHGRPDGLSSDNIRGLLSDRQGRLWIDTASGLDRLRHFEGESSSFDHISVLAGRPGLYFGGNLLEDRRGRIWTQWHVLDVERLRIEAFGRVDGVDIGTAWIGSHAKTRDGLLLFGGTDGLVIIDPERFSRWDYAPPVIATELKINGRPQALGALLPHLALSPDRGQFSLEFSALDYTDPQQNRYAYRLLGQHEDWIETDAEHRIASYGGLWPGDYVLEIRGSGRSGVWSPELLRVPLRVSPAYWQTTWFAALMLLGLIAIVWAALRWNSFRLRARAEELRTLVEARTSELRQSNEHLAHSKREAENAASRLIEAQQQLVMREKMAALGTLTAGVAHEINNPTNFADGAVQQLKVELGRLHEFLRQLAGDDASPEVLAAIAARFRGIEDMAETAHQGHDRIKRIVRDLRQFSRLDEADRKSVPIAEPIQSTVNLVRTRFDRIRFQLDLAFNPQIDCQPAKLGQVFMNLIVNACEAIAECTDDRAGEVRISSSRAGEWLQIEIDDNGAGIDAHAREHIFEPFFTTKAVGKGTGLGLAIVFGIIKEHGGSIELRPASGPGCCFLIRLPLPKPRVDSS